MRQQDLGLNMEASSPGRRAGRETELWSQGLCCSAESEVRQAEEELPVWPVTRHGLSGLIVCCPWRRQVSQVHPERPNRAT